jgi:tetrahydromethanopterin S-methyltransferase subunit C
MYYAFSGIALLAMISLTMTFVGWLGLDESLFFRGVPVLAPFLSTAVIVFVMTSRLTTRTSNGIKMIAACSFFFVLLAAGSMALGGIMDLLGQSRLSNNALSASFLTGVLASGFIVVHWCAAGLSMLRPVPKEVRPNIEEEFKRPTERE